MTTAYFDFDDTLFPGDSILYWKRFYFKQRPQKRWFQFFSIIGILFFLLRLIDSTTLKKIFLMPLCYETNESLEVLAKKFAELELRPRLYEEILSQVVKLNQDGHKIIIISASPFFYLKYLNEIVPNLKIIGTKIRFPVTGFWRFPVFENKFGNMKGNVKVEYITDSLNEPPRGIGCYAFSDSHWDLPLLNYVDKATVVCPNATLRKIAIQKKWPIIDCKKSTGRFLHLAKKLFLIVFY